MGSIIQFLAPCTTISLSISFKFGELVSTLSKYKGSIDSTPNSGRPAAKYGIAALALFLMHTESFALHFVMKGTEKITPKILIKMQ